MKLLKDIKDMPVSFMSTCKNRRHELLRKDGFKMLYFYIEGQLNISPQLIIHQ